MNLNRRPVADSDDDDAECDVTGCEGTYVMHEHDRVCMHCGHISGTGEKNADYRERHMPDPWVRFEKARNSEKYDGFYGPDRVKFVGGFVSAYKFGDDFYDR